MELWHRISIFFHMKNSNPWASLFFLLIFGVGIFYARWLRGRSESWRRNCSSSNNVFLYLSGISLWCHSFAGAVRTSFQQILCMALTSTGCEGSWLRTLSGIPWSSVRKNCNNCVGGCSGCSSAFLFIDVTSWSDIYIRSYNTGRSFDPILMKFTWLVRVHSWVNPIVFRNSRPNRTTDMGENVPPKPVFRV